MQKVDHFTTPPYAEVFNSSYTPALCRRLQFDDFMKNNMSCFLLYHEGEETWGQKAGNQLDGVCLEVRGDTASERVLII